LNKLVIYGAGGFAREIAWILDRLNINEKLWNLMCFIDDDPKTHSNRINNIEILSFEDACIKHNGAKFIAGIGEPIGRASVVRKIIKHNCDLATIIDPSVYISQHNTIGEGCVIQIGCVLTTNIIIGDHVLLNGMLTIGHDVIIGNYTTIGPGTNISGWVHIGESVMIGAGVTISNGTKEKPLTIGDNTIIGVGSCIMKDVPANSKVICTNTKRIPR
jgi:sugar O-acyltransferase (sialic acid O-acetyltransferase NeuD family)